MTTFADVPEQAEAKRLLEAALADGPAHAYLFHGPAGVGKRPAAQAFAGVLLGDPRRVDARTHPDLRMTEALGEMIRIDEIRALHHDLHMRPFEADRRVYLIFDAHRMNDEAAAWRGTTVKAVCPRTGGYRAPGAHASSGWTAW